MNSLETLQASLHELRKVVHTTLLCAATQDEPQALGELGRQASRVVAGLGLTDEPLGDARRTSGALAPGRAEQLGQHYDNFVASLAGVLSVEVASPAFRQALKLFACELEVLVRAVGDALRESRRVAADEPGIAWMQGPAHADPALSLLSDAAKKSDLARQALEVAMSRWVTPPCGR